MYRELVDMGVQRLEYLFVAGKQLFIFYLKMGADPLPYVVFSLFFRISDNGQCPET
jgi:hypothetical protein